MRKVDINEHVGDLHAARARRIETVKHAPSWEVMTLVNHGPHSPASRTQPSSFGAVLRGHHGEDTEHDETPQGPVQALGDGAAQALAWG